jgi:hypothetical protein
LRGGTATLRQEDGVWVGASVQADHRSSARKTNAVEPTRIGGTEITRFNALHLGVLSRYAVPLVSLSCHGLLGKVADLVFEGFPAMAK